jgi:hypothetical protein
MELSPKVVLFHASGSVGMAMPALLPLGIGDSSREDGIRASRGIKGGVARGA